MTLPWFTYSCYPYSCICLPYFMSCTHTPTYVFLSLTFTVTFTLPYPSHTPLTTHLLSRTHVPSLQDKEREITRLRQKLQVTYHSFTPIQYILLTVSHLPLLNTHTPLHLHPPSSNFQTLFFIIISAPPLPPLPPPPPPPPTHTP